MCGNQRTSRWWPFMKPATSSSPACRRFSSCTCTSARLNRCTKSGSSAKSSPARGNTGDRIACGPFSGAGHRAIAKNAAHEEGSSEDSDSEDNVLLAPAADGLMDAPTAPVVDGIMDLEEAKRPAKLHMAATEGTPPRGDSKRRQAERETEKLRHHALKRRWYGHLGQLLAAVKA